MPAARAAALLIVDDDEKSQRLAADVLAHAGHAVTRVATGEAALAEAARTAYDLVLLDIQLPGMSGVEVFQALRARADWQGVPVVAMTASVMPSERSSLMAVGFDAFVAKPLRIRELVATVADLLARHTP